MEALSCARLCKASSMHHLLRSAFVCALLTRSPCSACILGAQRGCNISVSEGLTHQIAHELNRAGYAFVYLDTGLVRCSPPCVNMLQDVAAESLQATASARSDPITRKTNTAIHVNQARRLVRQACIHTDVSYVGQ
jgi:hypothetical protein